ncbi:amino acid adenylation domain-containing protein [Clostridium sp. MB40-C1]|uniref:non-ribosomal peptide synthetase n=1 Tax=Clostridium sp. MB40-C1 TaxID=3070996 RepID=UPI0027E0E040|nr:amino acid adenylation domain-containing protein [Clostridium sp. MB40-C1]WMJ80681.1 amino acid adenylation domain-containing protein [Clostridium sp. MB40-C1]
MQNIVQNYLRKETINRLLAHFKEVLCKIIDNPESSIGEINIVTKDEKELILNKFNDTYVEYDREKTLVDIFEEQVKKAPNNTAVVFENEKITYKELNEKANSLAMVLRKNGARADKIVGIMLERSIEMIVAIIGVLKSGAAYLPIDPKHPKNRIEYMLKNSETNILLSIPKLLDNIDFNGNILDMSKKQLFDKKLNNLNNINVSKDMAYIIYTSGTTGTPKGVMVENRNILNTLYWRKNYYEFSENDVTLQIPSFSFDSSVEDIFTTLISGAKLVLINEDKRLDIQYLKDIMLKEKITNFLVTPSLYASILSADLQNVKTLRNVTVAGESIPSELIKEHFKKFTKVDLFNEYGPTENSVCSTVYKFVKNNNKVLIGTPISNTRIYIIDEKNKVLPIGVKGELCISGFGLTRGYLNNEKLTSEKFVDNPYEPGKKMYKNRRFSKMASRWKHRMFGTY